MGLGPMAACCALLAIVSTARAQTKVAIVNLQQAVFDSAEIKKANEQMLAKYQPRDAALQKTTNELAAAQKKLDAGQDTMEPLDLENLQSQIAKLQRDIDRMKEDLQTDVERDRNEILGGSTDKMTAIIRKIAEQRGFDMVVDAQFALYFKDTMDITKEATAAYDVAYPVDAPAPAKPAGK
jgi:outer membrane protein